MARPGLAAIRVIALILRRPGGLIGLNMAAEEPEPVQTRVDARVVEPENAYRAAVRTV